MKEIYEAFVKNRLIVLIIPLIMAAGAVLFLFLIDQPLYRASATLVVKDIPSMEEQPSSLERDSAGRLYATYAGIVTSKRILDQVIADSGLDLTAEQLMGKTTVSYVGDSNIMVINIDDSDPRRACRIANQIAETYIRKIDDIIREKDISLLDEATIPPKPLQIRKGLKIAAAAAAGLIAAAGLVFIREFFIPALKEQQEKGD